MTKKMMKNVLLTILFIATIAMMVVSCTSKPADTVSADTTKVVADTTIVVDSTANVQ